MPRDSSNLKNDFLVLLQSNHPSFHSLSIENTKTYCFFFFNLSQRHSITVSHNRITSILYNIKFFFFFSPHSCINNQISKINYLYEWKVILLFFLNFIKSYVNNDNINIKRSKKYLHLWKHYVKLKVEKYFNSWIIMHIFFLIYIIQYFLLIKSFYHTYLNCN